MPLANETIWLKLVPDAEPNADGRWIEVPKIPMAPDDPGSWLALEKRYAACVPAGEHLVAISGLPRS